MNPMEAKRAAEFSAEPEETFDSLRTRIRDRFDELSPHLQRVARLALDQPDKLALRTIASIAKEIEIQPSTVVRFAKEFDYDGFRPMQQVFKFRLIEGGQAHREQVYQERSAARDAGDVAGALDLCVDSLIGSLEQFRASVDLGDLGRAARLVGDAANVYVAGLRRSRPIATYLAYGLTRLERRCALLDFGGGMAPQQVATMTHEDLLVAIAFAPHSQQVIDVARDAHLRGRRVLAITDAPSSPLARNSTTAFYVDAEFEAAGRFRPISGAIALVQTIILTLSERAEDAGGAYP